MPAKLTQKDVISRFQKIHGDFYDYSKVVYKGAFIEVDIICPIHGPFSQKPDGHYQGAGCKLCGFEKIKIDKTLDTDSWIKRMLLKYKDKFNYSKVNFINLDTEVDIICNTCKKTFSQKPKYHGSGAGCKHCSGNQLLTTEIFIDRSIKIHHGFYTYENSNYNHSHENLIVTCPIHGEFEQLAYRHLRGFGCKKCSDRGFNFNKPGILYYLKHISTDTYKSGITNRTLKQRFSKSLKEFEILSTEYFKNGEDAYIKEQSLLEEFRSFRITNEKFGKGGKTEFFSKDVRHLDASAS